MKPHLLIVLLILVTGYSRAGAENTTPAVRIGAVVDLRSRLPLTVRWRAPADHQAIRHKAVVQLGLHGVRAVVHWRAFEYRPLTRLLSRSPNSYILSYWVEVTQPKTGIVFSQPTTYHTSGHNKGEVNELVSVSIPWKDTWGDRSSGQEMVTIRSDGKYFVDPRPDIPAFMIKPR
jgi:hypothetical protein